MSVVLTVLVLILIFGVLVGVHELGHFIAAKRQGVWAQEFAFGFGPTLFSKEYGETIYKINLIPLGGYVKLFGEQRVIFSEELKREFEKLPDKKEDEIKELSKKYHLSKILDEDKLRDKINGIEDLSSLDRDWLWMQEMNDPKRINNKRRYSNQPIWRRMIIVCAGVTMNFIVGILIYFFYLVLVNNTVVIPKFAEYKFIGATVNEIEAPVIIYAYNDDYNDLVGVVLLSVDGKHFGNYDEMNAYLDSKYNEEVKIAYFKNGKVEETIIVLDGEGYDTNLDAVLNGKVVLTQIEPSTPAESGGLIASDIIIKINGEDIVSQSNFLQILDNNKGKQITIDLLRPGEGEKTVSLVLLDPAENDSPKLGARLMENSAIVTNAYVLVYDNFLFGGVFHAVNMMGYQFTALGNIFSEAIVTQNLDMVAETVSGPIGVGAELKNLIEVRNFIDIINIAALISLTLAFMNILPLPVTDGGHVVLLVAEKLRGRPLSDRSQQIYNLVGIAIIIVLSVLISVKDIAKLIG